MRIWMRRMVLGVAAGAGVAALLIPSAGAQIPPPPTLPPFTTPTFPPPTMPPFPTFPTFPTTTPPPTMPPSTTTPPPTMPPSTTTPPPTMPPTSVTLPPGNERMIEDIIDQLEGFGSDFSDIIQDLREILNIF
jgi:hypothetical protein